MCIHNNYVGRSLFDVDMKSTFIHGNLEGETFMVQPSKITQPIILNLGSRLKKLVYGLKQSPRKWYDFYNIQICYIFEYDCYLYVRMLEDGSYIFILMYVDDMLIVAKSMLEVDKLKTYTQRKEFNKKDLGTTKNNFELWTFVGQRSKKVIVSQELHQKGA